MIRLTRLNQKEVIINADLIEMMEETPDVVITMTTGRKLTVNQDINEIIDKTIKYKAKIINFANLKEKPIK